MGQNFGSGGFRSFLGTGFRLLFARLALSHRSGLLTVFADAEEIGCVRLFDLALGAYFGVTIHSFLRFLVHVDNVVFWFLCYRFYYR